MGTENSQEGETPKEVDLSKWLVDSKALKATGGVAEIIDTEIEHRKGLKTMLAIMKNPKLFHGKTALPQHIKNYYIERLEEGIRISEAYVQQILAQTHKAQLAMGLTKEKILEIEKEVLEHKRKALVKNVHRQSMLQKKWRSIIIKHFQSPENTDYIKFNTLPSSARIEKEIFPPKTTIAIPKQFLGRCLKFDTYDESKKAELLHEIVEHLSKNTGHGLTPPEIEKLQAPEGNFNALREFIERELDKLNSLTKAISNDPMTFPNLFQRNGEYHTGMHHKGNPSDNEAFSFGKFIAKTEAEVDEQLEKAIISVNPSLEVASDELEEDITSGNSSPKLTSEQIEEIDEDLKDYTRNPNYIIKNPSDFSEEYCEFYAKWYPFNLYVEKAYMGSFEQWNPILNQMYAKTEFISFQAIALTVFQRATKQGLLAREVNKALAKNEALFSTTGKPFKPLLASSEELCDSIAKGIANVQTINPCAIALEALNDHSSTKHRDLQDIRYIIQNLSNINTTALYNLPSIMDKSITFQTADKLFLEVKEERYGSLIKSKEGKEGEEAKEIDNKNQERAIEFFTLMITVNRSFSIIPPELLTEVQSIQKMIFETSLKSTTASNKAKIAEATGDPQTQEEQKVLVEEFDEKIKEYRSQLVGLLSEDVFNNLITAYDSQRPRIQMIRYMEALWKLKLYKETAGKNSKNYKDTKSNLDTFSLNDRVKYLLEYYKEAALPSGVLHEHIDYLDKLNNNINTGKSITLYQRKQVRQLEKHARNMFSLKVGVTEAFKALPMLSKLANTPSQDGVGFEMRVLKAFGNPVLTIPAAESPSPVSVDPTKVYLGDNPGSSTVDSSPESSDSLARRSSSGYGSVEEAPSPVDTSPLPNSSMSENEYLQILPADQELEIESASLKTEPDFMDWLNRNRPKLKPSQSGSFLSKLWRRRSSHNAVTPINPETITPPQPVTAGWVDSGAYGFPDPVNVNNSLDTLTAPVEEGFKELEKLEPRSFLLREKKIYDGLQNALKNFSDDPTNPGNLTSLSMIITRHSLNPLFRREHRSESEIKLVEVLEKATRALIIDAYSVVLAKSVGDYWQSKKPKEKNIQSVLDHFTFYAKNLLTNQGIEEDHIPNALDKMKSELFTATMAKAQEISPKHKAVTVNPSTETSGSTPRRRN